MLTQRLESKEPNFLRKLRSEHGSSDRHERQLARPKKQLIEKDDDQPSYVLEGSYYTMTKEEHDALVSGAPDEDRRDKDIDIFKKTNGPTGENLDEQVASTPELEQQQTENIAVVGGTNKRRVAKVVCPDDERDEHGQKAIASEVRKNFKAKKNKRVRLSFDDETIGN